MGGWGKKKETIPSNQGPDSTRTRSGRNFGPRSPTETAECGDVGSSHVLREKRKRGGTAGWW